jgi:hypothetical protein
MRFEINVDVPRWFVYFFCHPTERLVVECLASGADVVHGCFADEKSVGSISVSVGKGKAHLAAFLTSIGADCNRINRRT